jgi:hypothetical protein
LQFARIYPLFAQSFVVLDEEKNSEGCEFHFVDKSSRSDRSFPLLAAKTEGEAQDIRIARHALKLDAKFPGLITNLQIGSKMSHSIGQTRILTAKRCSGCFKSVVFDFIRRSVTKRGSAASSLVRRRKDSGEGFPSRFLPKWLFVGLEFEH